MRSAPATSARGALAAVTTAALLLTACGGPELPASVAEGTRVTVGWSGSLSSLNAASLTGATPGNVDVAALTRGRFVDVVKGAAQPEPAFGTVAVQEKKKPFTVRYDLAEPAWSDGVPVDAADLLLAWAASTDRRSGFQTMPGSLAGSTELPVVDEFGRAIEVAFADPVLDWQTALEVAVPAHVVGQIALRIDDPMEAKQAVVEAIRDADSDALTKIATVWSSGFDLKAASVKDERLLVSSGPYRVEKVAAAESGTQRVELVANGEYVGARQPKVEKVALVQASGGDALEELGTSLDVVQLAPTRANWGPIHQLERRDFRVSTTHDGTMWVLALRADKGLFKQPRARAAFLRAVPRGDLAEAAGPWGSAYEASDALLVPPGGDGYQIVTEDSGFATTFESGDAAAERAAAGVPAGAQVCVAFDSKDAFAAGAVGALQAGMAEAGWAIRGCGRAGLRASSAGRNWQAMLVRVPVPVSMLELSLLWSGTPSLNLSGVKSPLRDEMIAALARAVDVYTARERRASVERSIVDDAIALPIAMNPVITVTAPRVGGVDPRSGAGAGLTSTAADWTVEGK